MRSPEGARRPATRRAARTGVVVLAVVALGLAALWSFQRSLIYHPGSGPAPTAAQSLPGAREVTAHTEDGLELGAWYLPGATGDAASTAVLYLPGNGGDRSSRAGIARLLAERGFAVLLLDYRGYGGNPGSPSEDGLVRDARAGVELLGSLGHPPEEVVYVGESIGTGVAARLAYEVPPAGMLLRSPFPVLADVARHQLPFLPVGLLLREEYPTAQLLSGSDVPVSVVAGTADDVVPADLSAQVAQAAPALVEELLLRGADHNDPAMFGPEVADAVVRLAEAAGVTGVAG